MENIYIIGEKNGKYIVVTAKEVIENALEQERAGIKPHYAWLDYKEEKPVTGKGWLVWSSINHGCGVVYRRYDGKMIIVTGVQGDFAYIS